MNTRDRSSQNGFTLIELCIVLIITSLMLVGAIQAYTIYNAKQEIERKNLLMDSVEQAFNNFPDRYIPSTVVADAQGRLTGNYYARLPRPAPLNSASAGNNYDAEVAVADVNAAVASGNLLRVTGTGGASVLIGKLPTGTLEVRNEYMKDIHGNHLLYAVTEAATVDLQSAGAITVIEEGVDHRSASTTFGELITYETHPNAQYTIVSMGANGNGAYAFDGSRIGTCPADVVKEGENCNLDDVTFRVSLLNERSDSNGYYDDYVLFKNSFSAPIEGGIPDYVLAPAVNGEDFEVTAHSSSHRTRDYKMLNDGYVSWKYNQQMANEGGQINANEFLKLKKDETFSLQYGTNITGYNGANLDLKDKDGNIVSNESRVSDDNFVFSNNPAGGASNSWGFSTVLSGGSEGTSGSLGSNLLLYTAPK
jgi:prepilin-type N-terminal cleavage/methylation domain-containing protein